MFQKKMYSPLNSTSSGSVRMGAVGQGGDVAATHFPDN